MVTRGFTGRGSGSNQADRVPPGQHLEQGFPVLSAGPTPLVDTADWKFTVKIGPKPATTARPQPDCSSRPYLIS